MNQGRRSRSIMFSPRGVLCVACMLYITGARVRVLGWRAFAAAPLREVIGLWTVYGPAHMQGNVVELGHARPWMRLMPAGSNRLTHAYVFVASRSIDQFFLVRYR